MITAHKSCIQKPGRQSFIAGCNFFTWNLGDSQIRFQSFWQLVHLNCVQTRWRRRQREIPGFPPWGGGEGGGGEGGGEGRTSHISYPGRELSSTNLNQSPFVYFARKGKGNAMANDVNSTDLPSHSPPRWNPAFFHLFHLCHRLATEQRSDSTVADNQSWSKIAS